MNQLPFNYGDIEALCDERVLALGRAYWRQGDVRELKIAEEGCLVTGTVRESPTKPFSVVIRTNMERSVSVGGIKRPLIESVCSCPVGASCKHVVALCLEALDSQKHVTRRPPPTAVKPSAQAFKNVVRPPLEDVVTSMPADQRATIKKPSALPVQKRPEPPIVDLVAIEKKKQQLALAKPEERVAYILNVAEDKRSLLQPTYMVARPVVASLLIGGEYGAPRELALNLLVQSRADYFTSDDRAIGKIMHGSIYSNREEFRSPPGDPELLDQLMRKMITTGRCFYMSLKGDPLKLADSKIAKLGWRLEADGAQAPCIIIDDNPGNFIILPAAQPWYVNLTTGQAGPLSFSSHLSIVQKFLAGPKVMPHEVAAVAKQINKNYLIGTVIPPRAIKVEKRVAKAIKPALRVTTHTALIKDRFGGPDSERTYHQALMHFEYDGEIVELNIVSDIVTRDIKDKLISMPRDHKKEEALTKRLMETPGLSPVTLAIPKIPEGRAAFGFPDGATSRVQWLDFVNEKVPELRKAGWNIAVDEGFADRFTIVEADAGDKAWNLDLQEQEGGSWWFSLDLGIMVEGHRVALLPLLMQAMKRLREPTTEAIESLALSGKLYVDLPDGRALALPFDRVRDIMTTLLELYDQPLNDDGSLNVSLDLATALSRIETATQMRWMGGARLKKMLERLKSFDGLTTVPPPAGLVATLRPYQQEGLNWLQFLREYNLGGILADDMGLGKTIQTLAHILIEKDAKRLKSPCLIICPTSLVPNWEDEAAKFAPQLKVVALRGKNRAARFSDIEKADLVLTTYPLLARDAHALLPVEWHIIVLDEAQAIKNPTSQVTQLVCQLQAKNRLCLTGTPIENHLGEVWSHFAFLMPGMLSGHKDFNKRFRVPIEKHKDLERQALLARRLKPFILRRNKSDVAKELPPKTEIIHYVEFDSTQRDLYETLRLTMHDKVQEVVESKGFNKSRIVILDALMKLRQACCDPRLVKLTAAQKVTASAKLESLMDLLPEMIEEGRRILLFSQFTSMLDLIKPELVKANIKFVEIRGDTTDRKTPVTEFQKGDVPLFLISLKAGGTGLNLTAADTVIHYDPWWNPAAENQATDRAHRIGQQKSVFVYKFIAKGTVEERILDLQQRKRGFAAALLEERSDASAAFEAQDLDFLFQETPVKADD